MVCNRGTPGAAGALSRDKRREMMTRKLETGEYLSEREKAATTPNRLRPVDYEAQRRAEENKQAAFKKH
jgi:hypothetical protein